MKNVIKIAIFLLVLTGCEEVFETQKCSDDPLEEILVLKQLVVNEQAQNPGESNGLEIIQYTYQNEVVYLVNDCINNCSDALTVVYNCDETIICEFGGIAGLNTCPDFEMEATDSEVLFSTRNTENECDKKVIISKELFDNSKTDVIESAVIDGDCLNITFSLLSTQDRIDDVELIDSGDILESFPIQRNLKLTIKENFTKPAVVQATTSFDISSLASPGETVILNLENFETSVRYTRGGSCTDCDLTQEEELEILKKMLAEIEAIADSVVCENAEEWEYTPIGSKACGGPSGFIAYSTKIDVPSFLEKVETYTKAEDDFNKKWGIVSTCDVLLPPNGIACDEGKAIFLFYTTFDK